MWRASAESPSEDQDPLAGLSFGGTRERMNRLHNVDVEGVHLVGDPANRRPFALMKAKGSKLSSLLSGKLTSIVNAGRRTREQVIEAIAEKAGASASAINAALRGSSARPDEKTLSAFASILGLSTGALHTAAGLAKQSDGDQTVKLSELLKAAGITVGDDDATKKALEGDLSVEKMIEAMGAEAVAKALGVEIPKKGDKLDKTKLAPDVQAYIDGLEKKVDGAIDDLQVIQKATTDAADKALGERVAFLKSAGIDVPEKATDDVVTALEKANQDFTARLVKMGVFAKKGDPTQDDNTARAAVAKAVSQRLGRAPINAIEDANTRREIYRENPGLLKAVTAEERAARTG